MKSEIVDSMLVRMARAMAASEGSADWRAHLGAARASLEVLREPSPAMLDAATPGLVDWGDLPDDWRAMIDHVLSEAETSNDNKTIKKSGRAAS